MANMRTAMDSAFWDQPISSPQSLDGSANSIPGEPLPLDATRASRALRIQQLSLLRFGFPLGIIPSLSPVSQKELGSLSLQSVQVKQFTSNWWVGLVGQFRPKKLISNIRKEISNADELELPVFRDAAKHFLDKSLYSLGICSQISLGPSSSLLWSTERHGEKKNGRRHKLMLYHQLPSHDITLEAAWPQLFIDQKGKYWDVPESISLDMSSLTSDSGFRYRFGLHKNGGKPESLSGLSSEAPVALMPGVCAKGAFSYERSKDIWRRKETKEDLVMKTDKGKFWRPAYDVRLKEPHATISAIIGGTCAAWFGGSKSSSSGESQDENVSLPPKRKRSPVNAEFFSSVCYTFQLGRFRQRFGDLTRLDARLDLCSVSGLARRLPNILKSSPASEKDLLSSPRLNLIFQQQIAGPIVFRVDSKFLLDSTIEKQGSRLEDIIYSLSYSMRLLGSGKVVAWYSPKRKEGMVELRLYEF